MSFSLVDQELYINRIHAVMEQNGLFPDEITNDESLDLDSLSQTSLLVCFENEFGFEFSDEELSNIPSTYDGLVQLVLRNIESLTESKDNNIISCKGGGFDYEKT